MFWVLFFWFGLLTLRKALFGPMGAKTSNSGRVGNLRETSLTAQETSLTRNLESDWES